MDHSVTSRKIEWTQKILLLTRVKISHLLVFIVSKIIMYSERQRVNCIYSADYQQLSFREVLLLMVMSIYFLHIIKHITIVFVTTTTIFGAYYYYYYYYCYYCIELYRIRHEVLAYLKFPQILWT
jgi:hypothetical protein